MFWIGLITGGFVGALLATFIMNALSLAKHFDEQAEKLSTDKWRTSQM